MFDLGLTLNDLKRVLWSALFGAVVAYNAGAREWEVLIGAAVAAGLAAVKNGVLADGSRLKG